MPTAIGKRLRSRKVKMACERRQNELIENQRLNSNTFQYINNNLFLVILIKSYRF
jgi:hypothetical protein